MLYFTIQNRLQDGTSKVSEAAGARWRFCVRMWSDYPRIILELSSNRLSIGGSIQGVSAEIWRFQISWQAHYLVRVQGDFTCSTHWKWRFICDADQWWHSFCVAGAVFGDVGGRLYLLRANTSPQITWHHRHATAKASFKPKKKIGHRNGRSSCAHSIGKFFLCYMVLFSFETSATGSPGNYLYI